jgi:hypothetical protein
MEELEKRRTGKIKEEMMIESSVKGCIKTEWHFILWFLYAKKGKKKSWACFKTSFPAGGGGGGVGYARRKKKILFVFMRKGLTLFAQ